MLDSETQFSKLKSKYDKSYTAGNPIIDDKQYDIFIKKFKELFPNAKALREVGAAIGRSEKREKLPIIVGSLDLQRPSDLHIWMKSIEKQASQKGWLTEPKFDGVSLTVAYENDQLDKVWSRGKIVDGESLGYDVTPAAKYVQGVIGRIRNNYLKKPNYLVRGELIMHQSIFKKKYLGKAMPGKPEGYQNARNLCAGLINRKDASEVKEILKDCTFVAYNLFYKDKQGTWIRPFSVHKEWLYLTFAGFTTAVSPVRYSDGHWKIRKLVSEGHETLRSLLPIHEMGGTLGDQLYWDHIPNEDEIIQRMNNIQSLIDIRCDGIVVCPMDITKFVKSGEHLKSHPSFIRAVKLDVHDQLTLEGVVKEVEWNISKRGLLKPVIILKKGLNFDGVIVNRCTGINAKLIKEYQIESGTKVSIVRSGEVIPRILRVNNGERWIKIVEK